MRWRLLFALGFVVIVGALIALRDAGYLGGRHLGGPLTLGGLNATVASRRDVIAEFGLVGQLHGDPVRVQNVRPRVLSPELEVLGPNLYAGSCGACFGRSWPPHAAPTPLEDSELRDGDPRALIGLRAQRPGLYYALGFITDYRRGQRRYRDREQQSLCFALRTRQTCSTGYRGPGHARVAQVGGPSRYPGARLTEAAAAYDRPGHYALRVTLSNRTRSAIRVTDLALDENGLGAAVTTVEPDAFRLAPHGYQVVRLGLTVSGCRRAATRRFGRLRAELERQRRSIPLSLPLQVGCVSARR